MSVEQSIDYRGTTLRIGDLERPYFEAAGQGRLVLQTCQTCSVVRYPPAPRCQACGSKETRWTEMSGAGRVYACVVVEHSVRDAFPAPYAIGLVGLADLESAVAQDDSVRLLSTILDKDGETPLTHPLPDGTPVEACFRPIGDRLALPEFRITDGGG